MNQVEQARIRLSNAMEEVKESLVALIQAEVQSAAHLDKRSRNLKVTEAADLLGVSPNTIYREVQAGRLGLVHIRGSSRVPLADVERLLGEG